MQVRVFQEVQPDCDREKLRTGAQRMPGKGWAKVEEGGQWWARGALERQAEESGFPSKLCVW